MKITNNLPTLSSTVEINENSVYVNLIKDCSTEGSDDTDINLTIEGDSHALFKEFGEIRNIIYKDYRIIIWFRKKELTITIRDTPEMRKVIETSNKLLVNRMLTELKIEHAAGSKYVTTIMKVDMGNFGNIQLHFSNEGKAFIQISTVL